MTIPFQDLKHTNHPFEEGLLEAAGRVIRSGRYVNGPEVETFEREMAAACGARFCVAVSTGLDALRLILEAYKAMGLLEEGDEVIVPANTFVATFLAVAHAGLTPVAVDIDEETFCLDFRSLPITEKTRAVIPVHLYGNPCWDAAVLNELHRRGILIIEDNAQAIGGMHSQEGFNESRRTGNLGDAAAVSFYPAKNIGALGDAGAVLTNSEQLALTVRSLANYGGREKYRHELCGYNCRMDEMQAALLRIKLPLLEQITEERRQRAMLYDRLISHAEIIRPRIMENGAKQVWHQYVIRHPQRDRLREYLKHNGIGTEIHYPVPCHRQPCFNGTSKIKTYGELPTAERIAGEILSLPVANATEEEINYITETINRFHTHDS